MNRIQKIGLACAVVADKAVDPWRKVDLRFVDVFKVEQGKSFQIHRMGKLSNWGAGNPFPHTKKRKYIRKLFHFDEKRLILQSSYSSKF